MEQTDQSLELLDLMTHPGFCAKDKKIIRVNAAAEGLRLEVGSPVSKWLATGKREYLDFTDGCLYLTLELYGQLRGARVIRVGQWDVFLLEPEGQEPELQALALAARELRDPLTSMMSIADCLFPTVMQRDHATREYIARLTRGMYQLLRLIGNMSDADRYGSPAAAHMETTDITALMGEIFEKAGTLTAQTGVELTFTNLKKPVFCPADRDMLERAIWNLLSNSLKFTAPGGHIQASLTQQGKLLRLSIRDDGEGLSDSLKAGFFHRYQRRTAFEDPRQGIGLGMVLVRAAAAHHGGTVLLDQPDGQGARVTLTLALRERTDTLVRSPLFRIDYAGELDHALIELSESLPTSLYEAPEM